MDQALVHIRESYYYGNGDVTVNMPNGTAAYTEELVDSILKGLLDSLDKDSRMEKGGTSSLGFVRGLEEEDSITEVRLITPDGSFGSPDPEKEFGMSGNMPLSPVIGYIKINFFGRRTGVYFQKALETLGVLALSNSTSLPIDGGGKGGGDKPAVLSSPSPHPLPPGEGVVDGKGSVTSKPRIKGLLLDLRDNPGGHIQSALEVLKHFVPQGEALFIEKTRGGEKTYLSEGDSTLGGLQFPIIVLINDSTASSAEIVAATLRYNCGARVVGEKSKGKGTIQKVIPLGTRTLILTVGEYLLPDGTRLRGIGVLPDLEVKGYEEQLQAAFSLFGLQHVLQHLP